MVQEAGQVGGAVARLLFRTGSVLETPRVRAFFASVPCPNSTSDQPSYSYSYTRAHREILTGEEGAADCQVCLLRALLKVGLQRREQLGHLCVFLWCVV